MLPPPYSALQCHAALLAAITGVEKFFFLVAWPISTFVLRAKKYQFYNNNASAVWLTKKQAVVWLICRDTSNSHKKTDIFWDRQNIKLDFWYAYHSGSEIFVVRKNLCLNKFGWIWVVVKVLQPWKEWAAHLVGLRQLDAQRQSFCPNFLPIWKASNSIWELLKIPHFGGGRWQILLQNCPI